MRVWGGGVGGRGGVERGEVEDAAQAAHPCVSFQALLRCGAFSLGAFLGWRAGRRRKGRESATYSEFRIVPHSPTAWSVRGLCAGISSGLPQAHLRAACGQRVGMSVACGEVVALGEEREVELQLLTVFLNEKGEGVL